MRHKIDRQAALQRLVRTQTVGSQDEMVIELRRLGFASTQASISRDVRELGLVKLHGRYRTPAQISVPQAGPGAPGPGGSDNGLITGVEPIGANFVLLRTPPGAASAVAANLDRRGLAEIVGTIAGDDTVLVAVRSRAAQGRVLLSLRTLSAKR